MQTLISEEEIRDGVSRMAEQVVTHYGQRPLTILGVLVGSVVFLADLIRRLPMPLRIGLIQAKSYRGAATRPGELALSLDLLPEIADRDVLVIDDIFDTGNTLARLLEQLKPLGPRSLQTAVLLRKAERCQVDLQPDYIGFEIPNKFVVGYGLDYNDQYRNLPYVAALDAEDLDT